MLEIVLNLALIFIAAISLGALAAYFSEKAGIANIAVDGAMIIGALAFSIVFKILPSNMGIIAMVISILVAGIAGILVGMLFALLTVTMRSDHIIAGTAVNLLAPALAMAIMGMMYNSSFIAFNYNPFFFVKNINVVAIAFTLIFAALVATTLIRVKKQNVAIMDFAKDKKNIVKNVSTVVALVGAIIS